MSPTANKLHSHTELPLIPLTLTASNFFVEFTILNLFQLETQHAQKKISLEFQKQVNHRLFVIGVHGTTTHPCCHLPCNSTKLPIHTTKG